MIGKWLVCHTRNIVHFPLLLLLNEWNIYVTLHSKTADGFSTILKTSKMHFSLLLLLNERNIYYFIVKLQIDLPFESSTSNSSYSGKHFELWYNAF